MKKVTLMRKFAENCMQYLMSTLIIMHYALCCGECSTIPYSFSLMKGLWPTCSKERRSNLVPKSPAHWALSCFENLARNITVETDGCWTLLKI